jgi:putative glutamine amidotransferase
MELTIGITDCSKWTFYESWLAFQEPRIKILRLKAGECTIEEIKLCNGIILSGGEDVHPSNYGKPEYIEKYKLSNFNLPRDEFEVLNQVMAHKIPLLGICRGLQITNVFFKGTLIPDLPSAGKTIHSSADNKTDVVHPVKLLKESRLYSFTGEEIGETNSHHHQAVGVIGECLKASAYSNDGVVEGMEIADSKDNSFLILLQWHPERMNPGSPFSGKLRHAFVKACEKQRVYV